MTLEEVLDKYLHVQMTPESWQITDPSGMVAQAIRQWLIDEVVPGEKRETTSIDILNGYIEGHNQCRQEMLDKIGGDK